MNPKAVELDNLSYKDHHFLESTDNCFFFGEYTANAGYSHSETNQLISNFKKSVKLKAEYQYRYKKHAILRIADLIASTIKLDQVSFLPIPPSQSRSDPEYDPRLMDVLNQLQNVHSNAVHIIDAIENIDSLPPSHKNCDRSKMDELVANYKVDEILLQTARPYIIVFDDVLTTGRHFKAVQQVIANHVQGKSVIGLFVARRVPPNPFEGFF